MKRSGFLFLSLFVVTVLVSCAGLKPTVFVHHEYNFNFVERVAVIPFENLSNDQGAGARITRLFISELLARESFDIVEPGEVTRALEKFNIVRTADLTKEQVLSVGKELGVQALFLGTVNESSTARSGTVSTNIVTVVARLVETESGVTVWSSTHTEGGRSFWASLFGLGEKSKSEISRDCVKKTIKTLIK